MSTSGTSKAPPGKLSFADSESDTAGHGGTSCGDLPQEEAFSGVLTHALSFTVSRVRQAARPRPLPATSSGWRGRLVPTDWAEARDDRRESFEAEGLLEVRVDERWREVLIAGRHRDERYPAEV